MITNEQTAKVTVIDSCMGTGKTSKMISFINESDKNTKFLYITPYLDEVTRIIHSCPSRKFKQPIYQRGSKLENIKSLINKGENIVSTHALFRKFNKETIELAYINNYILIMDEVDDVVTVYTDKLYGENRTITPKDIEIILENFAFVDPNTYLLRWTDDDYPDNGVFSGVKEMAELDSLTLFSDQLFLWLFPTAIFQAFRHVYILTYMFDAQIQKYYYDLFNIKYKKLAVQEINGKYEFIEYKNFQNINKIDYKQLINIVDNEKLNAIGFFDNTLSSTWYSKASVETLKIMKNNIYNFFFNITKTKSDQNLWTTYKKYTSQLSGKGYTKGFASINLRATNIYRNRTAIAYTVNRYLNPNIKNYFVIHGVTVNEDLYALSEMLQFIWRSAIRDDKQVTLYIPSLRMRNLLTEWINQMDIDK